MHYTQKTIYSTTFCGVKGLFLHQVDDFAFASPNYEIAKAIYGIIGNHLKLPGEEEPSFAYTELVDDYNSVHAIWLPALLLNTLTTFSHGWDKPSPHEATTEHKAIPFSPDAVTSLYKEVGPPEDTPKHSALQEKQGFSYNLLLIELMYEYVICHPHIGYHMTNLSKFQQPNTILCLNMLCNNFVVPAHGVLFILALFLMLCWHPTVQYKLVNLVLESFNRLLSSNFSALIHMRDVRGWS